MTKQKSILFFIYTIHNGGAEKSLLNLLNILDSSNTYRIHLLSLFKPLTKFSTIKFRHITFSYIIPFHIKGLWLFLKIIPVKIISSIIFPKNYDYYIAYSEGIETRLVSSLGKKYKKICWVHSDITKNKISLKVYKNIQELYNSYKEMISIVLVSKENKKNFDESFPLVRKKTKVMYNYIDTNTIQSKANESIDEIIDTDPSSFNFLSVGRLSIEKGYDRIIDPIKNLKNAGFRFKFYIIGEGLLYNQLKKMIQLNNLDDTIKLLGFKMNPYAYFKFFDCYVCASRFEGLSTTSIEAILLGLPVFTTNCSGMKEITQNEELGKIFENSVNGIFDMLSYPFVYQNEFKKYKLRKEMPHYIESKESIKRSFDNLLFHD